MHPSILISCRKEKEAVDDHESKKKSHFSLLGKTFQVFSGSKSVSTASGRGKGRGGRGAEGSNSQDAK